MGMNKINLPELAFAQRLTHWVADDFDYFVDADVWTKLASDGGSSVAAGDVQNGAVTLTTGATDNNECALFSTEKTWLFANNKPMVGEFLVQYTENATNKANIAAGFSSAIGANLLVDDGAGPATSMSAALIYKVDGETVWRCVSSLSTTQTISKSTKTAGGSAAQLLRIEIMPTSSTICEVTFYVDDQPLFDAAVTSRNQPIKHYVTYTSAAAMMAGVYLKAGGAGGEVAVWDRTFLAQTR